MPSAKYSSEIQKSFRRVDTVRASYHVAAGAASACWRRQARDISFGDVIDERRDWIVWDGACGFCRRAVAWAMARDHARRFVAVPNHDVPPSFVTPERAAAFQDAVHVRTASGAWLRGGRACLYVLEHTGWPRLARIARVPPLVWIVEAGYRVVASNRVLFSRIVFRARAAR